MSEDIKDVQSDEEQVETESIANTIYALASALESLKSYQDMSDLGMLPKGTSESFQKMQRQIIDSLKFYCGLLPH